MSIDKTGNIEQYYVNCNLCPRKCMVNRYTQVGYCRAPGQLYIARAALHMWEEPCISGTEGSGTIFFTGCNMGCVFCQNDEISHVNISKNQAGEISFSAGKEVTIDHLAEIMLTLQEQGANNINLVTPTHYVPSIAESIKIARRKGLNIPIVYNTGGYESVETIKMLSGLIDIYLPDFKYMNESGAINYSNASNYADYAKKAIKEMYHQTGPCQFNEKGMIQKGVIVRHLMLPGNFEDSVSIIRYLYETYHDGIYISIMNQYTPMKQFTIHSELNRKITKRSYEHLIRIALELGINNAFIQEGSTASESFIPKFDGEGV